MSLKMLESKRFKEEEEGEGEVLKAHDRLMLYGKKI
jgi:hypothetical protein